jgi:hypothetical protein
VSSEPSFPIIDGMKLLPAFSCGVGGRLDHAAADQLKAFERLAAEGTVVAPVWSTSASGREAAARAVAARRWEHSWFIGAGPIRTGAVGGSGVAGDFFTLDVSAAIGRPATLADIKAFVARHPELCKPLSIPGITKVIRLSEEALAAHARTYMTACREAGTIWRHMLAVRGDDVVIEVSIDATDAPQPPGHLLVILAILAEEKIPIQAIAPRFASMVVKTTDVEYRARFEQEFSDDIAVCAFAASRYGLPATLKLSVPAGNDTAALYPVIRRTLARTGAGVHVKVRDAMWLEEPVSESLYTRHLRPLFGAAEMRQPVMPHGLRSAAERC